MFLPIRTDSPLRSNPWMNWLLIGLNLAVFAAQWALPEYGDGLKLDPRRPHIWQFVTYAFLHQDLAHILMNMLFLYIFGNNVNDKMGHGGYLAFYLAGGVFAGLGHAFSSLVPVIGASGAVSAVTGAYLILFPRSHITIIYFFFFIGSWEIPSMWFILFYFLKDVLMMSASPMTRVAYMAHISGTIFGAVICFVMLAVNMLPRDQFDVLSILKHRKRRWEYQNLVRSGYDPFAYDKSVRKPAGKPDPAMAAVQDLRAQISEALTRRDLPAAAEMYVRMRSLDPRQVLSRQAQLDVANQLASQQRYFEAVDAYEAFLAQYPNFDQIEQVELMAGILCARYLLHYERARQHLLRALARLHGQREIEMARAELARIEPMLPPITGTNPT